MLTVGRSASGITTTFNPATGAAMFTSGTVNGQTTFEVQPEMLPRLKAGLDRVRVKYEEAQGLGTDLGAVLPPAWDEVTKQVTKNIAQLAQGGENSLFDHATSMIEWVDSFRTAVEQAIIDAERVDEANRMD